MAFEFVWDPAKAAANLRKHGVSFPEATTALLTRNLRPSRTLITRQPRSA